MTVKITNPQAVAVVIAELELGNYDTPRELMLTLQRLPAAALADISDDLADRVRAADVELERTDPEYRAVKMRLMLFYADGSRRHRYRPQ